MNRSVSLLCLVLLAPACEGDTSAIEPPEPICNDLQTTIAGDIAVTAWPGGQDATDTALSTMNTMAARYTTVDSCKSGGETVVKVTGEIARESLPLVTSPYSEIGCGCQEDTANLTDSEYEHIAQYDGATLFVEDGYEPGAQNITVFTDTALFGADTPFLVRTCGGIQIEPYRESAYTQLDVVFRIDAAGQRSGSYILANDEETVECVLTTWVAVAPG